MANDETSVKQTAVEWLAEVTAKIGYISTDILEKAKQMEKLQKLTISNYDLEEMATDAADNYDSSGNWHVAYELYKKGFQKALELLTFKSE